MASFVSLIRWTQQGILGAQTTVERSKAGAALAQEFGGKLTMIVWTLGPYDAVALWDFPDSETYLAFVLELSSRGNSRLTSMRAFDETEMARVTKALG